MPTGYTDCIGDDATFKEFVLRCACSRFYECDKLPEKFDPTDFYKEKIIEYKKKLECLERMTEEESEIAAQKDYEDGLKEELEYKNRAVKLKKKYLAMLKKVKAWNPPSEDHINFKQFMIDQITMSIDCDCYASRPDYVSMFSKSKLQGSYWLLLKKSEILNKIKYYEKEDRAEQERVNWRNNWINLLRDSLKK